MNLYNLFPLLAGKVADWTPHLERAKQLGFDWVFVNPVHYPGYSGSLYSIKDYFEFNPLLIDDSIKADGPTQFRRMAKEADKLGLKLIADLVVNHCAFDSPLVKEHPDWFIRENGKPVHPWCMEDGKKHFWSDLVQFDHKRSKDREGLFRYMLDVVEFLIGLGFSGFRCDAAYQLPDSFWRRLISETRRKHPHTKFLAETLGCSPAQTVQTAKAGFDYIFNSAKWWDYHSPWLMEQYALTCRETPSISFAESHDTARLMEELHGNVEGVKQRYLFTALFASGVMMPMGFEFGFRNKLHVVKTRPTDWEQTQTDLTSFIQGVNLVRKSNPVFLEDAPTEILHCDNPNILFLWKGSLRAKQEALIVLNKDIHHPQHFYTNNLYQFVQTPGPLHDVSPEFPMDYLHTPFDYGLRPGQAIVLVTDQTTR
ncbi:MAG TPA: alpha-amylase family glycosyl hydrolase [Verrucomicrobiota bacterium]|nr:alpha-amylase family glycosyl hydrolase [Verrucomicrobiota bacterium]